MVNSVLYLLKEIEEVLTVEACHIESLKVNDVIVCEKDGA